MSESLSQSRFAALLRRLVPSAGAERSAGPSFSVSIIASGWCYPGFRRMVTRNKENVWNVTGRVWLYSSSAAIAGMAQRREQGPVMTTDLSHDSERNDRSVRRRKVRALLAGGLVLGVGAAVTLAAWTDNVFGQAEFSASNWNIQGNFTGSEWAEYDTAEDAGTFDFSPGFGDLAPDDLVTAPLSLRVGDGDGGDFDANVILQGAQLPASSPLSAFLQYSVYIDVPRAACVPDGDRTGGTRIVSDAPLDTPGSPFELLADGTVVDLCFEVYFQPQEGAAASAGTTTGPVVWQFAATAAE